MAFTVASAVLDLPYAPKITLTRDADGVLTAVLEVEGLDAVRTPSQEEQGFGVQSLNPVTVMATDHSVRKTTLLRLIAAAWRAVSAAVKSTDTEPTPAELSAIMHRTSIGLRRALREIGEDI